MNTKQVEELVGLSRQNIRYYEKEGLLKNKIRTEQIESRNLTVIRIPNNEVMRNFRGVCEFIDMIVKESLHLPPSL